MTITPSKIVCVGRNYLEHAREMGNEVPSEPLLFLKPPSSIIPDLQAIELPKVSSHVEFEGEIGLIIGQRLRYASESEAADAISHVVAVNDVTARDLQRSDNQWARAKGMDTFCPIGNLAVAPTDFSSIEVVTRLNGVECQRGKASDMAFAIPVLVAYITRFMTLESGDLVLTGTPSGTRKLTVGDVVEVELLGLSRVTSPVVRGR